MLESKESTKWGHRFRFAETGTLRARKGMVKRSSSTCIGGGGGPEGDCSGKGDEPSLVLPVLVGGSRRVVIGGRSLLAVSWMSSSSSSSSSSAQSSPSPCSGLATVSVS